MEQTKGRTVTPQMSVQEINAALAEGGEVTFAPGIYENAHYKLTCPVHILGYGAILVGGKRLCWKEENGVLTADTDAALPIRSLSVNGSLRTRCRMPESGYMEHSNIFDVEVLPAAEGLWARKPTMEERLQMRVPTHSLDAVHLDSAEATVVHSWDDSTVRIASLQGDVVLFAEPCTYPAGAFGVHKWCLWNVPEAFCKEGTFYHDIKAKKLYYRPLSGENVSTEAYIPTTVSIFYNEQPLSDVEMEGLTLTVTDVNRGSAGIGSLIVGGAIELSDITDSRFHHITIHAVGGYGFSLHGKTGGLLITRCHLYDCGAGGIRLTGEKEEIKHSEINNCLIHDIGIYYASSIALNIRHTDVFHCELYHSPYSGINCGGKNIRLEWNYIHDVMEVLSDGAAIYSYGSTGILRNNLVCGLQQSSSKIVKSAYYLDELSENWLVENNVAVDCTVPNHNHMCGHHLYRNNIFVNRYGDMRISMHNGLHPIRFVNNRYFANGKIIFEGPENSFGEFTDNICYAAERKLIWKVSKRYDYIGEKTVEGGTFADQPVWFTSEDRIFTVAGLKIDLNGVGVQV